MKAAKYLTYTNESGNEIANVVVCGENIWLTQLQMSVLFGCSVQEVYTLLKALLANGELRLQEVNRTLEVENGAGHSVRGNFYNLDAIIAVGYRLNPKESTLFHIWSMQQLKKHLLAKIPQIEYSIIEGVKRKISHMLAVA